MNLNQKFLRVNVLVVLGILVLSLLSVYQFNKVLTYYDIRKDLETVTVDVLSLRRFEKNFLARKDNIYLDKFNTTFDSLIVDYKILLADSDKVGLLSENLQSLHSMFNDYQQAFQSVVKLQNEIGLTPELGLYGGLREAVHKAEVMVDTSGDLTLYKHMLNLRRYEKDFMLRRDQKYIDKFNKQMRQFKKDLKLFDDADLQKKIKRAMSHYDLNFTSLSESEVSKGLNEGDGLMATMTETVNKTETGLLETRAVLSKEVNAAITSAIIFSVITTLLLIICIVAVMIVMGRSISSSIRLFQTEVQDFVSDLEKGQADLSKEVKVTGFTEIENLSSSFNQFTSVLAAETEKVQIIAKASEVVKQALDNASTPAMIVEPSGMVTYMNFAMTSFLQRYNQHFSITDAETAAEFSVNKIAGDKHDFVASIHTLQSSHKERVVHSDLTIDWQVTPIFDERKSITGHIVEWSDQTEQLKTETEVSSLISSAAKGDFSARITLEGKTGFFYMIADGLNNMLHGVDGSLSEVSSVLQAISMGDLDHSIKNNYSGKLGELADATNSMAQQLNDVIGDIAQTVNAVKKGQFDIHVSEDKKQGFYLTIAQELNALANVLDSGISDVGHVLKTISEGNLDVQVNQQYEGQIQELAEYSNSMASQLKNVVGMVSNLVEHAARGDFTVRIPTQGQAGFYLSLSENLNVLNESTESATGDLRATLEAMAKGNLTKTITNNYQGTFDTLKQDANTTIANLVMVLGEIKQGSAAVKMAADEISRGNLDLSRRTEQQAASLEETASSMEEMTSTIIQNTESSKHASTLAVNTQGIAEKGGEVVNQAIVAMGAISESSDKIADIISVIDEIAFQTNLLALNASVEAARAGEQGRGFAVVAGEVRNLAGRSATAAKEIKELIEDSGNKVEEGKSLVNESGEALNKIMVSVKDVSELVAEIAAASEEQSLGITEVNRAITKMDEMTQQNAALVEEVASTSDAMGNQASELEEKVGFFQTGNDIYASASHSVAGSSAPASSASAAPDFVMDRAPKAAKRGSENAIVPDNEDWSEF
ncbi:MAG: hypothetical protein HRU20_20350 [Pseudomonadales bacterium]|nr:hypothetical protein [Pseudomonadales bacterium]